MPTRLKRYFLFLFIKHSDKVRAITGLMVVALVICSSAMAGYIYKDMRSDLELERVNHDHAAELARLEGAFSYAMAERDARLEQALRNVNKAADKTSDAANQAAKAAERIKELKTTPPAPPNRLPVRPVDPTLWSGH